MNIHNTPEPKNAHGYVTDVPYTWSFFKFQNPVLLSYVARLKGHVAPDPAKPFAHCDLGCGNGVTTNLLAAAYPHAEFYGVDINSEHIDNARALAEKSGLANAHFIDASFDELDQYDLPKFDYITMHGVYSWVQAEVRDQIHSVIDRLLSPNGLVYLCYNTLPGASNLIPLWKMMQTYSANLEGDLVTNAQDALRAITDMRENNSRFFRSNPAAADFLDKLIKRDERYLVHEFSNACYEPQYFWDVAENFQKLGLTFAGSAQVYRNNEKNLLSSRHSDHLDQASTIADRESRASFIRNESFRWDIFINSQNAPKPEQPANMYFGAIRASDDLKGTVSAGRRSINLDKGLFRRVIRIASLGVLNLSELCAHPKLGDYTQDQVTKAVDDLVAAECLHPFLAAAKPAVVPSDAPLRFGNQVNLALIEDRLVSEGKTYLISPVSGFAVRLDFVYGLFAWACHENKMDDVRGVVENRLKELDPKLLENHSTATDANAWLDKKSRHFFKHYLPRLLRLGILVKN